jgi:hypothetical protein
VIIDILRVPEFLTTFDRLALNKSPRLLAKKRITQEFFWRPSGIGNELKCGCGKVGSKSAAHFFTAL